MALRNFTRNFRMFLDSFELSKEKEKKYRKNGLKIWSQMCRNLALYVQKLALKKKWAFKFLYFLCFYFFALFLKVILLTNIAI